jgi:hypothetical protein
MRTVKHGSTDHRAEHDKLRDTAIFHIQAGEGEQAMAASVLTLDATIGRIATAIEGFLQLAKDDEI